MYSYIYMYVYIFANIFNFRQFSAVYAYPFNSFEVFSSDTLTASSNTFQVSMYPFKLIYLFFNIEI